MMRQSQTNIHPAKESKEMADKTKTQTEAQAGQPSLLLSVPAGSATRRPRAGMMRQMAPFHRH
jgi:hypothetical protein